MRVVARLLCHQRWHSTAKYRRVHARTLHLPHANAEPLCDRVQRALGVVAQQLRHIVAAAARFVPTATTQGSDDVTMLLGRSFHVVISCDVSLHGASRLQVMCKRLSACTHHMPSITAQKVNLLR